ncbi:MAG: hypothetical protein ACHQCF_06670 [Solirubrobacterales bacterium]
MADELLIAFDSRCRLCQRFASLLADASGGRILPVALAAPETRRLLEGVYPRGFKETPYLITKRGKSVQATAGLGLMLRVGWLLGWRRSWRLFQEIRVTARGAGKRAA